MCNRQTTESGAVVGRNFAIQLSAASHLRVRAAEPRPWSYFLSLPFFSREPREYVLLVNGVDVETNQPLRSWGKCDVCVAILLFPFFVVFYLVLTLPLFLLFCVRVCCIADAKITRKYVYRDTEDLHRWKVVHLSSGAGNLPITAFASQPGTWKETLQAVEPLASHEKSPLLINATPEYVV